MRRKKGAFKVFRATQFRTLEKIQSGCDGYDDDSLKRSRMSKALRNSKTKMAKMEEVLIDGIKLFWRKSKFP